MAAKIVVVTTRLDEKLKKKLKYIADREDRNVTAQLRQVVTKYIREYEEINGEIKIDEL